MTLDQLRVFVAVAERLHVTRAAAALNITQSAASATIQALEARLGVALFDRVGRGIILTEAGQTLLTEARAVLARAAAAEQTLLDLGGLMRGHLSLWASQTVGGYWLPSYLQRFRAAHPEVSLAVAIGNTTQVAHAVGEGTADLGVVEGDVDDPLLVRIPVGLDEMVLVVAPGHEWAGLDTAPDDLSASDWVLREPGSGTRQIFAQAAADQAVDPVSIRVALELPSNEAVRAAVVAGAGATVLSRLVVAADLAAGRLVEVPLALPARQFTALRHGDRHRSRAAAALLEMMRGSTERADQHQAEPGDEQP